MSVRRLLQSVLILSLCTLVGAACDDGTSGTPDVVNLTVAFDGDGSGAVASDPAGIIDCSPDGGACTAEIDVSAIPTLTATPDADHVFAGWGGACTGTGGCTVSADGEVDVTVTASFDDPNRATEMIGAEGGEVVSPDGEVTLTVPAGALSDTVGIYIEQVDPAELGAEWDTIPEEAITGSYEFGPDGTLFAGAVEATVSSDGLATASGDTVSYGTLVPLTVVDGTLALLDSAATAGNLETGTATVTAWTDHFSPFGVADLGFVARARGVPASQAVGVEFNVSVDLEFSQDFPFVPAEVEYIRNNVRTENLNGPNAFYLTVDGNAATGTGEFSCPAVGTAKHVADLLVAFNGEKFMEVEAIFSLSCVEAQTAEVVLTLGGTTTGGVTSDPAGVECTKDEAGTAATCLADLIQGTEYTLIPDPDVDTDYDWTEGCDEVSRRDECTFTVPTYVEDYSVHGNVTQSPPYSLTIVKTGDGTGTVVDSNEAMEVGTWIDCGSDCSQPDAKGLVQLWADPDEGITFAGWKAPCEQDAVEDGVGIGSVGMTMDITCEARFLTGIGDVHDITLELNGDGTGSVTSTPDGLECEKSDGGAPASCTNQFVGGREIALSFLAEGYTETGTWTGCDEVVGDECRLTPTGDQTIALELSLPDAFPATMDPEGGPGSGEIFGLLQDDAPESPTIDCPSTSCTADFRGTIALEAKPAAGSYFERWEGCSTSENQFITVDVQQPTDCVAVFQLTPQTTTVVPVDTDAGNLSAAGFLPTHFPLQLPAILADAGPGVDCPDVVLATDTYALLAESCTGKVYRAVEDITGPLYDVLALEPPSGEADGHALVGSGFSTFLCPVLDDGTVATCQETAFFYTVGLSLLGGDPANGAVFYNGETQVIDLVEWDGSAWAFTSGAVPTGDLPQIVNGVAGNADGTHLLVLGEESGGDKVVSHVDRSGASIVTASTVITATTPSDLVCDPQSGLCAIADKGASIITTLAWDGQSAPTVVDATTGGQVASEPYAVDVFGTHVVTVGTASTKYSVITMDANGTIQSVGTTDLPAECTEPEEARFLRDSQNSVLVTCGGSTARVVVIPNVF